MQPENVLIFGISGVGKSTNCRRFTQRHPNCLYFSASELLSTTMNADREKLRKSSPHSILENQKLLGSAFNELRKIYPNRPALVDAHAIIYNDFNYVHIPTEVVRGLNPTALILLEAPSALVASRRRAGHLQRPKRTEQELEEEARLEKQATLRYADELSLPVEIGSTEFEDVLESLVPKLLKSPV